MNPFVTVWRFVECFCLIIRLSFDKQFLAEMREEIKQEEWERANGITY